MFKRIKTKLLFMGAILMTILIASGCETTGSDDEIIVAQRADPVRLDPHGTNDNPSAIVMGQIYDTLVYQDENLVLHPGVAEGWTEIDELTYEFKLKENVYFHNGEELTASDIEFTLRRALDSEHVAHIVGQIDPDSIKVINEYTIQMATLEPYAPFLAHLAHPGTSILNEKAVTEAGDQYGLSNNVVGTGPWILEEWAVGEHVKLIRNDDYHDEIAKFERLTIRTIAEASNRTVELETKGVDIALDISPADVELITNDPNLTLLRERDFRTSYLGFNTQKEPFDDVKVRQAINYAINVDAIVESVYEGVGDSASGPISTNVFGANLDLENYPYDEERANELLAEAGYENGLGRKVIIWTDTDASRVSTATVIRNQLDKIGIDAEIEQFEWGAYIDKTAEGEHDLFLLGWTTVTGDADYGLYSLFHSNEFGAAGNRTFYSNERVDELLDLARSTKIVAQREAYYYEVQEIIMEDAPWVAINVGETVVGVQNNVRGFTLNPNNHHKFKDVYFE